MPVALVLSAVVFAALSLLLGSSLRVDPEGWLRWGREIALGDGAFTTVDYPSWKPLPVLLTVPLAFCGTLGPTLWLVVERAAGLLALALVFDLARRRAGVTAGAVAVGALALTRTWWPTLAGGGIEPLLVALGCGAIDRHERGRHGQALLVLCLVALGREEAVLVVLGYGAWLGRRHGFRWMATAAVGAAAIVAFWLSGDWIGSGDPLHGGELAKAAPDAIALQLSGAPLAGALVTVAGLLAAPLWPAAAFGVSAAWRAGDRILPAVLLAAGGWVGADLLLAADGYPLPTRFLFPVAAAPLSVAAGIGATFLLDAALASRDRLASWPEPEPEAPSCRGPGP
jgi:hypothetical protein